ncbi:MAG: DUF5053 domain-containing protein [Agriterribacter sp.]
MKNYVEDIVTTKSDIEADKKIQHLKQKTDSDAVLRDRIKRQFKEELDKRGKRIEQLEKEITIKLQLKEVSKIVSISYIASKYFGQKKEWLYQRINGNIVNGKPATFTEAQKKQLNAALKDISKKIGSVTVS